jgi:hypothetical protein
MTTEVLFVQIALFNHLTLTLIGFAKLKLELFLFLLLALILLTPLHFRICSFLTFAIQLLQRPLVFL